MAPLFRSSRFDSIIGASCILVVAMTVFPLVARSAVPSSREGKLQAEEFRWSSLLPVAFQKTPQLNFTVVTDMTDAGKKLPAVSPDRPAYFELHASGYKQMGSAIAGEKSPKQQELEGVLIRSLAAGGYLPATPEHLPSIFIVYGWGSHNHLVADDMPSPVEQRRNFLDRAALVGGEQFALKLAKVLNEQATFMMGSRGMPPEMREFADPMNLFKMQNRRNDFVVSQSESDVYFVVASAYDFKAFTEKRRLMLWRTRMTVAAQGITQTQTLPTLILTAGPYFGKEMTGPEIISRRTLPRGNVEIGKATVVPSDANSEATSTGKK